MPLPLLHEWMAYARLSPFDASRDDWRFAMLGSVLGNRIGGLYGKKRPRAIKIKDLMPSMKTEHKRTPKEIYELVRMYAILNMGAKDKPRN